MASEQMYEEKEDLYFGTPRQDVLEILAPKKFGRVLEVGAAGGATLIEVKKRGIGRYVCGMDLFEIDGSYQDDPLVDKFMQVDLNTDSLAAIENKSFDLIIAADVLEHLTDPWSVLLKLESKLSDDGTMLVSLPNIRYLKAIIKIVLFGSFRYEKSGIFDQTHLRFFCYKDMLEMFKNAGLEVQGTYYSTSMIIPLVKWLPRIVQEVASMQILFLLKPKRR